jgi:hypothetical protein
LQIAPVSPQSWPLRFAYIQLHQGDLDSRCVPSLWTASVPGLIVAGRTLKTLVSKHMSTFVGRIGDFVINGNEAALRVKLIAKKYMKRADP